MKGMSLMLVMMLVSIVIASMWNTVPIIKEVVNAILNPTLGALFAINVSYGMLIVSVLITLITTLLQKYTTNQAEIKRLKDQQKAMQAEMKNLKDNPEKMMDLQRKQLELSFNEMMPLTMKPLFYTIIPFILLLRWFSDYFTANPTHIFGFFSWFWAYLIFSIVSSIIFRKLLKVH